MRLPWFQQLLTGRDVHTEVSTKPTGLSWGLLKAGASPGCQAEPLLPAASRGWGLCVYTNQRKRGMKYFFIRAAAGVVPPDFLKSPEKWTFCTYYFWAEGGMSHWQNEYMEGVMERGEKVSLTFHRSVPHVAWSVRSGNPQAVTET